MNIEKLGRPVRRFLQRFGFDFVRYRSLNTLLVNHGVSLVFDVGANVGQYGTRLREIGYRGKIVSFEPQKTAFAVLSALARRDGNWIALNLGLGSANGQQTINVYRDSSLSSMLTLQEGNFLYEEKPVAIETIEVRTLDSVIDEHANASDKILLKIDTQGFEKPVLAGAQASLPRLAGVQMEMSLTPIYAGQPRLDEMIALLHGKGFTLWQLQRGAYDMGTGQELEVDGVFMRTANEKQR